jgi:hypothetical protein
MAESKSTELAKSSGGAGGIALYKGPSYLKDLDIQAFREVVSSNIGDDAINAFDLIRVGMPGSGGLAWTVPSLEGEPESVKEIECVVLFSGKRRAYWSVGFDESGGGTPPDCSSLDGKTGVGYIRGESPRAADGSENPPKTRSCATCPMSAWGSADFSSDGKPIMKKNRDGTETPVTTNGQACTERRLVFAVRPGDMLPIVIDLAPTSIKEFDRFMLRLTTAAIPSFGAVVGLSLKNETSGGGIKYSVVMPRLVAKLDADQANRIRGFRDVMKPKLEKIGIDVQASDTPPGEDPRA